jgi:hypothetical protein
MIYKYKRGIFMRYLRCLFSVLFIFSPSILYTQILVSSDIDIFINGFSKIDTIMTLLSENNGGIANDYLNSIQEFIYSMGIIVENEEFINNNEFDNLEIGYQKLMQIKAPTELNDVFNEIGWNNNGHRKFVTILLVMILLVSQEEYEIPEINILFGIFNNDDIVIIEERIYELIELFEG